MTKKAPKKAKRASRLQRTVSDTHSKFKAIEERLSSIAGIIGEIRADQMAIAKVLAPIIFDLRSRGVPGNIAVEDLARINALTDKANEAGINRDG